MSSTEEKPLAVGAIQDPQLGPRVVIVLAHGAIAFTPDQARALAMQIRVAANQAETGKHAGEIATVLDFIRQGRSDGPRH